MSSIRMEEGFTKADSRNLPKVDSLMIANFFTLNPDYCSAEFRNVKTSISSRQSYGDDAIGYVQVKRDAALCTVVCKICPEHKVRQKNYTVNLVVHEKEGIVQSVQCHDCPASLGGCKHSIAFLMWVHRRSEEPPCTSVECYWKKPTLAKVGSTLKFMTLKEMVGSSPSGMMQQADQTVFKQFIDEGLKRNLQTCQILKHMPGYSVDITELLSMHYLSAKYNKINDCDAFINDISHIFTDANIKMIEFQTRDQHKSMAWHELRYTRLTASNAFNVTRCKTPDGTLIASIMGAKIPDTYAMKRGRELERNVKIEIEKQHGKIIESGLIISRDHPMLAASPDGILNGDTVIEIKCPSNDKYFKHYISKDNQITAKFYCQVQLQMYLTKFNKCLFCVASSDFERNKKVHIIPVQFDEDYINKTIIVLKTFWKNNIYPLLYKSTK